MVISWFSKKIFISNTIYQMTILKDSIHQLSGTLHIRVYDKYGVEAWQTSESNLIVATGYDAAAQALAGVEGARIAKIAIGTNGTSPVESDTKITDPLYFEIKSIECPAPAAVRFTFSIGYTDAVDMTIREFGLIAADGRLFSRKVREPIEKTQFMSIVVVWEITF